jgi:hypothetical protein
MMQTVAPQNSPEFLYQGGKLNFSIIQADKNTSGLVFGHGKRKSRIQIFAGDKYLDQSVVTVGVGRLVGERKEKKYEWVSFDSTLRDIHITPDCAPIVRIVIYDCDRNEENKPLGEAHLFLRLILNLEDRICELPIQSFDAEGTCTIQGTIKLKVSFALYPSEFVAANSSNSVECSRMNKISFAMGWNAPPARRQIPNARFGMALVMFDNEGKYVDSVDEFKRESTKGAYCHFETIVPLEGFAFDKESIFISLADERARNISSFFLVLLAKTDFSSLQELEHIYFRMQNGRTRKELYRFDMSDVTTPSSSLIIARFAKEIDPAVRAQVSLNAC